MGDKDKKQILLRISPSLWTELAAWAEDDFRSINGQIEFRNVCREPGTVSASPC